MYMWFVVAHIRCAHIRWPENNVHSFFLDVEDLYEPLSVPFSYPNGLSENASLVEKLKHMEARALAAEAALAGAREDLQKMK